MTVADTQDATYQIWVELKTNLHRFIARRASNDADADDILQELFVKIHLNIVACWWISIRVRKKFWNM